MSFSRFSKEANIAKAKCVKREVAGYEVREVMGRAHIMWDFEDHSKNFRFYSE